jgi:hypothetical protein
MCALQPFEVAGHQYTARSTTSCHTLVTPISFRVRQNPLRGESSSERTRGQEPKTALALWLAHLICVFFMPWLQVICLTARRLPQARWLAYEYAQPYLR